MRLNIGNNKKNESANAAKQVNNPVTVAAAPVVAPHPIEEAVAVEIKDTPKAAPKKKPAPKKSAAPKAAKDVAAKGGYTIQEYTTKKGGTAYLLFGFESKEAAEAVAEKCSKTVSASWRRNEKGEQLFCLSLGTRYGEVAKAICDALNKGDQKAIDKACAASKDVYELAVAAGKAEREAKKQERAEAKAEKAAAKAGAAAKGYSDKDVAAMLSKIMAGGDIPEGVRKHMKMAKAA